MLVEVLDGKVHDRNNFDCGHEILNKYLRTSATQDVKSDLCQVYVVSDNSSLKPKKIFGYFSLSAYYLLSGIIPDSYNKNIKKYPGVPAILLGRLAKDKNQTELTGDELLYVALKKARLISRQIGASFLVTHPKKGVERFYRKNGFKPLPSKPSEYIYYLKQVK